MPTAPTPAQIDFFRTFGYVRVPGLLADSIGWIQDEFEAMWAAKDQCGHDGSRRTMFPASFIDASERMCRLMDDPRIDALATALLGEGWGYYGGDGNLYAGDTGWHCDAVPGDAAGVAAKSVVRHLKIAFYLDPTTADTGALRVIPGSFRWPEAQHAQARETLYDLRNRLGIDGRDVPCAALATTPGDILCFDHLTWHAAFGGSDRRRMFTMNLHEACGDEARIEANRVVFGWYGREGARDLHSETMLRTASPARMRRLDPSRAFVPTMAAAAAATAAAAKG